MAADIQSVGDATQSASAEVCFAGADTHFAAAGMQQRVNPGMQGSMNLPGLATQRGTLGNLGGMSALGGGFGGSLGNALGLQNSPGRNPGLNLHSGVGLSSAAYPPSGDLIAMMNKANVTTNNSQLLNATQSAFGSSVGQQQQQQAHQQPQQQQQQQPPLQQQQQQQSQQHSGQPSGQGQAPSIGGPGSDQPVFDQSEFPALGGGAGAQRQNPQGLANGDASGYNGMGSAASMYNNVALQGKAASHFGADFSIQNESEFPALGSVDGSRGGDDQSQDNQAQASQKVSVSCPCCRPAPFPPLPPTAYPLTHNHRLPCMQQHECLRLCLQCTAPSGTVLGTHASFVQGMLLLNVVQVIDIEGAVILSMLDACTSVRIWLPAMASSCTGASQDS